MTFLIWRTFQTPIEELDPVIQFRIKKQHLPPGNAATLMRGTEAVRLCGICPIEVAPFCEPHRARYVLAGNAVSPLILFEAVFTGLHRVGFG